MNPDDIVASPDEVILPPDKTLKKGPVAVAREIIVLMRALGISFAEARAMSPMERANFLAALSELDNPPVTGRPKQTFQDWKQDPRGVIA